jgi:hypothetical protein
MLKEVDGVLQGAHDSRSKSTRQRPGPLVPPPTVQMFTSLRVSHQSLGSLEWSIFWFLCSEGSGDEGKDKGRAKIINVQCSVLTGQDQAILAAD